jgi:2-C-methyl-D-erythritol 2,4-cyclodiphosphate synthase
MVGTPPIRIGQGWDTHRLVAGKPLIIGGIEIPSEFGLSGHSDADVLFHAVTDAVLGAVALGDIGMHFPDTAPEWKGAASLQFLQHALNLAADQGYTLANLDTTVLLERPKLKDFRAAIRENLARAVRLPIECVSVKFKTGEKVGPVGEGLSCEAQAAVLLAAVRMYESHSHARGKRSSTAGRVCSAIAAGNAEVFFGYRSGQAKISPKSRWGSAERREFAVMGTRHTDCCCAKQWSWRSSC